MQVKNIILESIESVNKELKIKELESVDENTPLFELLDSLGTLDLILELENRLQEVSGNYIAVASEESMDAKNTPFKNIATLETFLEKRMQDESN